MTQRLANLHEVVGAVFQRRPLCAERARADYLLGTGITRHTSLAKPASMA